MTQSFATGVIWMLLSATGMAFIGLFAELGFGQMSLTAMVFWRFVTAFILCFLLVLWLGRLQHVRIAHIKMNFLRSFFLCASQYSFFYYIEHDTLLNGIVLLNTGPLFIPFVEKKLFGNTIGVSSWVGLIVSFVGVLCVLQPKAGLISLLSLVGLLAGLSQAISQVLFGMNTHQENRELDILSLTGFMVLLSFLPYLLINEPTLSPTANWLWVIGIVLALGAATVLNQLARGVAYQHGTPSRLSPFLYFSVIVAAILDWAVFRIIPNALSIFGAGLVVLGGVLKIYIRYKILQKQSRDK